MGKNDRKYPATFSEILHKKWPYGPKRKTKKEYG